MRTFMLKLFINAVPDLVRLSVFGAKFKHRVGDKYLTSN